MQQVTVAEDDAVPLAQDNADRADVMRTQSWHHRRVSLGTLDAPLAALCSGWLRPAVVALSLLACAAWEFQTLRPADVVIALAAALMARQIFTPLRVSTPRPLSMLLQWAVVAGLLMAAGVFLGLDEPPSSGLVLRWLCAATCGLLALEFVRPFGASAGARPHRYLIVGANELGLEFQQRESRANPASVFLGYFDFRDRPRVPVEIRQKLTDDCLALAGFVQRHAVTSIYIAIPMSNTPRIGRLTAALRDTTASIYFVPSFFAFDHVQARCVESNGMALLSICDTPFHGIDALRKRAFDVAGGAFLTLLAAPVMLLIALAVKLTSRGPILFRQRRYGLHGEEIIIYKFRSMTVCEDGDVVVQAQRHDPRVTRVGRWLRALSLDELPQLFNVLQGRMSLVGPRPHAVAHNEAYRALVDGYMVRHKVRPGITGWAQVSGLRGEIGDLEQLRRRVHYDLEYLRKWSLSFDLRILLRTLMLAFRPGNAY
jgi:putative colanic acid biosynthesis UDP-glucose lipid carrier transferase